MKMNFLDPNLRNLFTPIAVAVLYFLNPNMQFTQEQKMNFSVSTTK